MNRLRIRLGGEPIVHSATGGGWTACNVMYGSFGLFRMIIGTPTEDPVDCISCLVQEAQNQTDVFVFQGSMSIHAKK